MLAFAFLLAAQPTDQPVISIRATVDAQNVRVQKKGEATINVTAQPDAGSIARSSGTVRSRHFELQIDARIADPLAPGSEEPPSPNSR